MRRAFKAVALTITLVVGSLVFGALLQPINHVPNLLTPWIFSFVHGDNGGMPVIVFPDGGLFIHWYVESVLRAYLVNTGIMFAAFAVLFLVWRVFSRQLRPRVS